MQDLHFRWHPRAIYRSFAVIWIWWFPSWIELSLSWWLRWSRKTIIGMHLLTFSLQN